MLLDADGVEVGQSVLELAQQEYRLRAQPHLARTLANELHRRWSRSLSLSLSSGRPGSSCSYSTSKCKECTPFPENALALFNTRLLNVVVFQRAPGRRPG